MTIAASPASAPRHRARHRRVELKPWRLSYPVFHLAPPYTTERLIVPGATPLPRGSVVGLDVSPLPTDWEKLEQAVALLRATCPNAALAVRVDSSINQLLQVTTRGVPGPVRAVLLRGQQVAPALRRQLTRTWCLPDAIVEWLTQKGIRMSPALAELVRQIFVNAPAHAELSTLCRAIGAVESSARFRFSKKRLPSPGRWLHLARALHAVFRLQADPERPLLTVALELGFSDHSALSHQIRRNFGVRPGEVRDLLGWEWLLDRWLALRAQPRIATV